MQIESLTQQIEFACFLMLVLIVLAYFPSNAEIAAHFRKWKAARATRRNATRQAREEKIRWIRMQ